MPSPQPKSSSSSSRPPSRSRVRASRAAAPAEETSCLLEMLPNECLVVILLGLKAHELLSVAWVCKRLREVARDEALWSRTLFSVAPWETLQLSFEPAMTGPDELGEDDQPLERQPRRHTDHTGTWTRCTCLLTQVRRV